MNDIIAKFFDDYAARFNKALSGQEPDIAETVGAFASCFVEASPVGIICSKNDERFRDAVPKGYDFYKSIGTQSMKIGSKVITLLDPMHALVKIHWQALYVKKAGNRAEVGFDIHYLVQVKNGAAKIFAYITGDEQQLLKDHGLEPYR